MLTMKELGRRAKFADYVCIQYIIDGIPDDEYFKACLYGATTFPVLKEKLAIYEKMKQKRAQQLPRREQQREVTATKNKPVKEERNSGGKQWRQRCYKCGIVGHVASACQNGVKCFKCNQFGHIGQRCGTVGNNVSAGVGASGSGATAATSTAAGVSVQQGARTGRMTRSGTRYGLSVQQEEGETAQSEASDFSAMFGSTMMADDVNKPQDNLQKSTKFVKIRDKTVSALIDSGSEVNLISEDLYDGVSMPKIPDNTTFTGLGHKVVRSCGKLYTNIDIDGQCYDEVIFHVTFLVRE
ncbi:uncharacterized protein LOC126373350 [Pectinophora gossypiella]|uniref:uncharacterized protein LOC126373350 n=1 Tax=Pectinophora gossypiella TaxID=13191 RepID=UPI00214E1F78|nr:uncharacterized protein LOC126373350 [Pectinophora gossypiella]